MIAWLKSLFRKPKRQVIGILSVPSDADMVFIEKLSYRRDAGLTSTTMPFPILLNPGERLEIAIVR